MSSRHTRLRSHSAGAGLLLAILALAVAPIVAAADVTVKRSPAPVGPRARTTPRVSKP